MAIGAWCMVHMFLPPTSDTNVADTKARGIFAVCWMLDTVTLDNAYTVAHVFSDIVAATNVCCYVVCTCLAPRAVSAMTIPMPCQPSCKKSTRLQSRKIGASPLPYTILN